MAMAIKMKFLANAVLLFCLCLLVLTSSEAKGAGSGRGRGRGRGRGHGVIGSTRHVIGRPNPNEKVFNVLQYGAKADGRKDNALAFIKTFRAACTFKGPARVLVPNGNFVAGAMVFEGPCAAPITFQFTGNVKAVTDPSSYSEDSWMLFENINGLVVAGTGTIDGQGQTVWKYNDGGASFPMSMKFNHITNGMIRQITSLNPMGFHLGIVLSQNIRVRNVHLIAPDESPNTDGIHISQSNIVKIVKSVIATGDDCVGAIQGSTDITIKKVVCGPGHGFSIGSLGKYKDEKDVRQITVSNCTMRGTQNGLRIKTWGGSPPSQASNMLFENIAMENVKNPIIIDQNYGSKSKGPSRVKISDIRYINIRGTTITNVAVNLDCSQAVPCERVQLSNINLKYTGPKALPLVSNCANAKVSYGGVQFPPPCRR